jgi:esterase/lipase superfamily enzyme
METPVLYTGPSLDPFAHLPEKLKTPQTTIFYATNRGPAKPNSSPAYTNTITERLRFGRATVSLGQDGIDWQTLHHFSLSSEREEPVEISLQATQEMASLVLAEDRSSAPLSQALQEFFSAINQELRGVVDKEIMVYVHGTKVDFTNAAILAAEIEHFAGRDFVTLAFSWPSHQNILSYVIGTDVRRAQNSSTALADLLALLAEHTDAGKIHLLSYSAGARVASKALLEMREQFGHLDAEQLRAGFRIGSVIFAAADVELDRFLDRLEAASEFADQVVITVSDQDNALQAARKYMGGETRAGTTQAETAELDFIESRRLDNVSLIDVSLGQEKRGFDIIGHHYWYRHPWMSSDIIFSLRTDLPPGRRGLQPAEISGLWYLSPEYPESVREAAAKELGSQW